MNDKSHIRALDGIRGLATVFVLLSHCYLMPACFDPEPMKSMSGLRVLLFKSAELGWIGVDIFFVLSGFLITRGLLQTREDPRYFRNFYARRALRLLPLYYSLLAFYFLLAPFKHLPGSSYEFNAQNQGYYWFYLQNLLQVGDSIPTGELTHLWSLAIEEQFYIYWPLALLLVPQRHHYRIISAGLSVAVGTRMLSLAADNLHPHSMYVFTLARMDGIFVGALLAMALSSATPALIDHVRLIARRTFPLASLVFVLSVVLAGHYAESFPVYACDSMYLTLIQQVGFPALALATGSFVALTLLSAVPPLVQRIFESRVLVTIGKCSYGTFILHPWLFGGLTAVGLGWSAFRGILGDNLLADLVYMFCFIIVGFIPGWLTWTFFESRVLKLKDRFQ